MSDRFYRQHGAFSNLEVFEYADCEPKSGSMPFGLSGEAALRAHFAEVFPKLSQSTRAAAVGSYAKHSVPSRDPEAGSARNDGLDSSGSLSASQQESFSQLLAAECARSEAKGRSEGLQMAAASAQAEAARQMEAERGRLYSQVAALLESYAAERESCLHEVEQEAVRLALAIAARIVRREVGTDPLLLTGSVRVALNQISASTVVRLHVPAQDRQLWEEGLALIPGLTVKPKIIGDETMESGDCRMETELGSADLGIRAQLKEIERSFFEQPADVGKRVAEFEGPIDSILAVQSEQPGSGEADAGGPNGHGAVRDWE